MSSELSNTYSQYDSKKSRRYALAMLVAAYTFNFIDRQILTILQEPIKAELGLSDTALGLLTGFAFAMFYVSMGIPIARMADKGVRRNIISVSVGVWSFFTAISGMVQNFWQLLLVRIGVGVGEAGCSPPAYSMISDIFPPKERTTALSIYNFGVSGGILFGFLAGGWINEFFGWRVAFLAVGLPGILLAIVLRFALKEPQRGRYDTVQDQNQSEPPSLSEVLKTLWGFGTFRHLMPAAALYGMACYGLLNWVPSFFIRTHEIGTGTLGTWFALILGIGGAIGTFATGYLADKLGHNNARWFCWITALAMGSSIPFILFMLLGNDAQLSLWLFIVPGAMLTAYVAPILSTVLGLVNTNMRATSTAITLLILNAVGLGLGPLIIGFLSDYLAASMGSESLRYAMLYVIPAAMIWAIVHTLFAARYINDELKTEA